MRLVCLTYSWENSLYCYTSLSKADSSFGLTCSALCHFRDWLISKWLSLKLLKIWNDWLKLIDCHWSCRRFKMIDWNWSFWRFEMIDWNWSFWRFVLKVLLKIHFENWWKLKLLWNNWSWIVWNWLNLKLLWNIQLIVLKWFWSSELTSSFWMNEVLWND